MRPKILALVLVILLGLVYSQVLAAVVSRTPDLRAELVVVLNMNRANPLGGKYGSWTLREDWSGASPKIIITRSTPSFLPMGTKLPSCEIWAVLSRGLAWTPSIMRSLFTICA